MEDIENLADEVHVADDVGNLPDEEIENAPNSKCRDCMATVKNTVSKISIEPVVFLYTTSVLLSSSLITNLLLDKICLQTFNQTDEACKNTSSNTTLQHEIQDYAAKLSLYSSLVSTLPSLWIGLFIGAYSDRNGRKLPLLLPCVGNAIQCLFYMVFAYFPWIAPEYCIVCAIPNGLTGGFAVFIMGTFSYISDVTKSKSRTGRIGIVNISLSIGAPFGLFLSGVLFQQFGYWPVYFTSGCLNVLNIIYISLVIKNVPQSSNCNTSEDSSLCRYVWSTTKLALYAAIRPRTLYTRAALVILVVALLMMVFSFDISGLTFLFTNLKFSWTYTPYIHYALVSTVIETIGTVICLSLFTKCLGVNDYVLGIITSFFRIASYIIIAFATSPEFMYISSLVNIGGLVPAIIIRSSLSKIIPSSELGKVFSIISSLECLVPIVADTLFTFIYTSTLSIMPGTVFLVVAAFTAVMTICFFVLLLMQRRGLYEEYDGMEVVNTPLLDEELQYGEYQHQEELISEEEQ